MKKIVKIYNKNLENKKITINQWKNGLHEKKT